MIIALSDVHLGYEKSNRDDFYRFLEACDSTDIEHLVLLGDILDFWRRNNARIVEDDVNALILNKLAGLKAKHVHYVVGNHDYYLLRLSDRYRQGYHFDISKSLRLEDAGGKFYFIHGYELEALCNLEPLSIEDYERFSEQMCFNEDIMGGFASQLWDLLQNHKLPWNLDMLKAPPQERVKIDRIYDLAISRGRYILLGMRPGEKLVYGHTHRPFISEDRMVANTGSWVDELSREKSQNRYIRIEGGRMSLRSFDVDPFP